MTQYAVMFEYAMNENRIEAHEIEIVNILPEMEQEIQLEVLRNIQVSGRRSRISAECWKREVHGIRRC